MITILKIFSFPKIRGAQGVQAPPSWISTASQWSSLLLRHATRARFSWWEAWAPAKPWQVRYTASLYRGYGGCAPIGVRWQSLRWGGTRWQSPALFSTFKTLLIVHEMRLCFSRNLKIRHYAVLTMHACMVYSWCCPVLLFVFVVILCKFYFFIRSLIDIYH